MIELAFAMALMAGPSQVQEIPTPPACHGSFETVDWQACADASGTGTPGYSLAMINLGTQAYLAGDYAAALMHYDKAAIPGQTISSDVIFHTFRGDTYRHAGRMEAAREDARWAWMFLKGQPPVETQGRDLRPIDDNLRLFVLSIILPILKDGDPAILDEARRMFVGIAAPDAAAMSNRAAVLMDLGDFPAAIAESKRAVDLEPGDPGFQNNHCYILTEAGQPGAGLPYCERAVALVPEIGAVRHSYATALAGLGRCADAERQLAEARRLNPDSALYREPMVCAPKA